MKEALTKVQINLHVNDLRVLKDVLLSLSLSLWINDSFTGARVLLGARVCDEDVVLEEIDC